MGTSRSLKIILSGLFFSSVIFAAKNDILNKNIDANACIDSKACPKLLEISLVNAIKSNEKADNKISTQSIEIALPLQIRNKSKRALNTTIAITHNNNKVNCGSFNVPGNTQIVGEIACNVGGTPYFIQDADGRSNKITISDGSGGGLCPGLSVGDTCTIDGAEGVIFKTDGVNGLMVSNTVPSMLIPFDRTPECNNQILGTAITNADGFKGKSNTEIIVAACDSPNTGNTDYAAGFCNELSPKGNWYVPASTQESGFPPFTFDSELNDIRLAAVNNLIPAANIDTSNTYWSSTEDGGDTTQSARVQTFDTGSQTFTNKTSTMVSLRCIRAF